MLMTDNGVVKGDSSPFEQKKIGELWSTNKKRCVRMLTYPKSTLGVLHMLMHLSLDHVTATRGISPF